MGEHKFKAGQKVKLSPQRFASNRHPMFEVMAQLPELKGINRYKIRSLWNQTEVEVWETELS